MNDQGPELTDKLVVEAQIVTITQNVFNVKKF